MPTFDIHTTARTLPTADIPIEGLGGMRPVLTCRPATEDNPAYFNALLKKQRIGRRARQRNITAADMKRLREDDIELMARHCITGWSGVADASDIAVAFTTEACQEFFAAIVAAPGGREIFDEFRAEITDPATFHEEGDAEDVGAVAGN